MLSLQHHRRPTRARPRRPILHSTGLPARLRLPINMSLGARRRGAGLYTVRQNSPGRFACAICRSGFS
jgi:hypothetical protein